MEKTIDKKMVWYYLDLVSRYRWVIIIPFLISILVGIILAFTLPRIYKADTVILVESQTVPTSYVRSLTTDDVDARIRTLSQQIMSRTNLEKIIEKFGLFSDSESKNMFLEDKIDTLRKRITLTVASNRSGSNAFTLSYVGKDPKKVMNVTNTLAYSFIEENMRLRELTAIGTSDFLDAERSNMQKRLERVEEKLKSYRTKYMGELPEQLDTNLNILDRLQLQLSDKMESLRNAKDRLAVSELSLAGQQVQPDGTLPENLQTLEQMRTQLANLRNRYTEQHPDVVRMKNKVKDIEQALQAEQAGSEAEKQNESQGAMAVPQFSVQTLTLKNEIRDIEKDIAGIKIQVKEYQRRVENTPKREQELMVLRRDYQNIQDSYASLLNRKLEAEIAVNMEKKQKSERFRVIDPAVQPEKPVSPNMISLFLYTIAVGLVIGVGFVYVLNYFDTSFRKLDDVSSFLKLPVLATIPKMHNSRERVLQKINQGLTVVSAVAIAGLLSVFALLTLNGVEQTMESVRKFVGV
jgi:polysaccharide chain length determinant protein (PEP-CTERM system associated)